MRRSGRKFIAGLLAAVMVASSAFSSVTTVHAEETMAEQSLAVDVDLQEQGEEKNSAESGTGAESEETQSGEEKDSEQESPSEEQGLSQEHNLMKESSEEDSSEDESLVTLLEEDAKEDTTKEEQTSEAQEEKQCAEVTASVEPGTVDKGTKVALSTATKGAVIKYNTDGSDNYTSYKGELEITEDVTIYAIAMMEDMSLEDSKVCSFAYQVKQEESSEISSVADARKASENTELTVKGIVTFIDGKNVYLQDATAGLDAYYSKAQKDIAVGDTLTVKGTKTTYNGLEELKNAETVEIEKAEGETVLPSKTITLKELLDDYEAGNYESTRVYLEKLTVGTIDSKNTQLTDADGNSINIFKIPSDVTCKVGDTINLYAIVGDFNGYQLRVASADDITVTKAAGEQEEEETLYDPVSDELIASVEGAVNVKEAAAATSGEITVVGQVVYAYASKAGGDLNNIVLEDVIDNEIYGYLVFDKSYANYDKFVTGDIVAVTGTASVYNGVPEITLSGAPVVLKTDAEPIEAQKVTTAQLGADYLSEYVCMEDVTLGAYKETGSTTITDAAGSAVIFKGAAYPDGVTEGSVVDVYAACSAYKTSYQLRNGVSADYKVKGAQEEEKYEIDDSIELTAASFAGTLKTEDTFVYGDLYEENDFLNKDAKLTLSNGKVLFVTDTSTGSKGLLENEYYLLELNSKLYANLDLSFRMRGSKTGARDFAVEYSKDGENFTTAGSGVLKASYTDYASGGTPVEVEKEIKNGAFSLVVDGKFHDISVSLPQDANNVEKLYVRVRVASPTSIKGDTIGSGGTNYFNEITVKANPINSSKACKLVTVSPEEGEAAQNQQLTLTTDTEGATIYYAFKGESEFKVYNADSKPVLKELPTAITVYAAKDGLDNSLKVIYRFTQAKVDTVKASPNGGAVALHSKVKLTCDTEGATILYAVKDAEEDVVTEDTAKQDDAGEVTTKTEEDSSKEEVYDWKIYTEPLSLDKLPCTIVIKATKDGYQESAVKTLSFTERANEKYNIYFGQLHAHTSYSDGAGTCEEAFKYAQDVDNLDFLAVTDHSNSFDNADNASIKDGSVSSEWTEGHELAKKYTTDDFVGIYGYEMTWSNGLGHMNTFNTDGFQSRTQTEYKTYSTALQNYYATLATAPDSISQFNHPGTTFGDFSDFAYYSETNDALITMVEVGNGEGAIGSSGYFPSYEYYTRALDKGWHVAPTNNQDNHKGRWGDANTARSVVLADSLTEESIYDAMRNYRIYATEDNDLSIYYTLDSYIMGTSLDKDLVGDEVTLKVDLTDPTDSRIGKVEVIVNGGLSIANKTVSGNEETVTFQVPSSYSYYYIKVTEADGDIAVTAPVWVGEVEAAGINAISTEEALPVAGEALDVTLDLYNNEQTAMNIRSIEFSVDGKTVKSVDLDKEGLTSVASESTAEYTFSYTHNKVGAMEMGVTVKADLNGVEKVYKDVLKLTYVDNSMVSHVIIDGTHFNDYVTGYYGGNMNSFVGICADKNIKAKIVTDKITKEMLDEASLLIVSAPAKKNGTANAGDYVVSHYEDSFIELVKDYVANGGSVIVCGIADYQDSTSCQTSTETNKLLEAIGSTIRMNSDEAYDKDNNGGQAYRLYYTNVNEDSVYLDGFRNGQTYSAYSGCTVDITGATKETNSVYPAQWLVKGFDTTYSIDCKTDAGQSTGIANDDAEAYVEKGKVVALASQKTKFGGEIFVAGSVFMSDFEVDAEIDNNDSLPYVNYTIINNILEGRKVELEATDIATVRKAEPGDVFAIEGYVANGTENEDTTFFDTIYVQDKTGGITVFPFATAGLKKGTKIRVVGYVDQYQGDKELQLVSYSVLDDQNLVPVMPTQMSVTDSMDYDKNGGKLIQVTGTVSKVEKDGDAVSEFWLTDDNGNQAAIFIDGYITSGTTGANTLGTFVEKGKKITAVGFLYKHPEGDSDESVPVLRVRDCDEIRLEEESNTSEGNSNSSGNDTTESSSTAGTLSTNTAKALTRIDRQQIPLAEYVTETGLPYVDVALNQSKGKLKLELLQKYYGRNLYLMAHLGNGVGFSILASDIQDVQTEYDFDSKLTQLPDEQGGFKVFYMQPVNALKLPYTVGIHMNLGIEYAGKKAYLFTKSSITGSFELVNIATVSEIGNVAVQTNELTDILVLIAQ